MRVYGVTITDAQIEAGLAAMKPSGWGRWEVYRAMIAAGVADYNDIAYRASDRLLQQERKAGRIHWDASVGKWKHTGDTAR